MPARIHAFQVPTIIHTDDEKVLKTEVTVEVRGSQVIAVADSGAGGKRTEHVCVRDSGGVVVASNAPPKAARGRKTKTA